MILGWMYCFGIPLLCLSSYGGIAVAFASKSQPARATTQARIWNTIWGATTAGPKVASTSTALESKDGTDLNMYTSSSAYDAKSSSSSFSPSSMDESRAPLKILFLSSDTGGGHRASAEALGKHFQVHFPGSSYDLLDVWTTDGCYPYRTLVDAYKHLSHQPRRWRFLYHFSNTAPYVFAMTRHSALMCQRKIRRRMEQYDPDAIVSVHPTMNHAPLLATKQMSRRRQKHVPFFTVVTDLGSGHSTWFRPDVDKLYVASEKLRDIAKRRAKTPDEKLVMSGLPIRHDFAVQAEKLGDRNTNEGKQYQQEVRAELGLNPYKPMVLVMGGGEGVGSLSDIVDELYKEFINQGIEATICVVCGRNEALKQRLEQRDWTEVLEQAKQAEQQQSRRGRLRRWLFGRRSKKVQTPLVETAAEAASTLGQVEVVGLGFVTRMAEYMTGADVLVSKAGPGTIAEAAALGLPCMLTSFLPGQESGNVDVVLEKGFGAYCEKPVEIAKKVGNWMQDSDLMAQMATNSRVFGHPNAATEIVIDIGTTTNTWKNLQDYSP